MEERTRILRIFAAVIVAFTMTSVLVVVWNSTVTIAKLQQTIRDSKRATIEKLLIDEHYPAIAEKAFLNIENLSPHTRALREQLEGYGDLTLSMRLQPGAASTGQSQALTWQSDDSATLDLARLGLTIGDQYLGELEVRIVWDDTSFQAQYWSVLEDQLDKLAILILLGVMSFYFIRRQMIVPLFNRLVSLQAKASIVQSTNALAHDIRKPFSLFRMGYKVIQAQNRPEEIKQVLEQMKPEVDRSIRHVERLISDVLEMGKDHKLEPTRFQLTDLVHEVVAELSEYYPHQQITLTMKVDTGHPLVADREKIKRAIANILDNAWQAIQAADIPQGQIWITLSNDTNRRQRPFVLELSNQGSQIDPAIQASIFEPYATAGKTNGTGLGLAIAQNYVELHQGTISCRSTETLGTTFSITLPVLDHSNEPQQVDKLFNLPQDGHDLRKAI